MDRRERVAATIFNANAVASGRVSGWDDEWPNGDYRCKILDIADAAIKAADNPEFDPASIMREAEKQPIED